MHAADFERELRQRLYAERDAEQNSRQARACAHVYIYIYIYIYIFFLVYTLDHLEIGQGTV